jgi:hypothetical protein
MNESYPESLSTLHFKRLPIDVKKYNAPGRRRTYRGFTATGNPTPPQIEISAFR